MVPILSDIADSLYPLGGQTYPLSSLSHISHFGKILFSLDHWRSGYKQLVVTILWPERCHVINPLLLSPASLRFSGHGQNKADSLPECNMNDLCHSSKLELFSPLKTRDLGVHAVCVYLLTFWLPDSHQSTQKLCLQQSWAFPVQSFNPLHIHSSPQFQRPRNHTIRLVTAKTPFGGPILRSTLSHHCNRTPDKGNLGSRVCLAHSWVCSCPDNQY